MSESGVSRFLNGPHSRAAAAFVLCLAAVVAYAARLGLSYPLRDWLFWRMAVLWLWCAFLCTACFAAGHVILVRVLRTTALPPLEMLVQSTALGLLVFVLGMYIGGFAHLYGATFAVVWPLLMIAAGARSAFAWSLERWRAWRQGAESRSRVSGVGRNPFIESA